MSAQPFKVEFDLCAPMQMDFLPIHLDGLLAWAVFQENMAAYASGRAERAENPADVNSALYDSLPLVRADGVYCASVILPAQTNGVSNRYFIRTSDDKALALIGMGEKDGKKSLVRNQANKRVIDTTRGELKVCFMTEQLSHVPLCVAYGLGDISRVESLLKTHVHGLGKNRAKGFGSVSEIRVLEDEQALEFWKIRSLPKVQDGYVPLISPVRPPYWNKSLRQISYFPSDIL